MIFSIDEAERQQGTTNDDSAEMVATLREDRRQTAMEEHRTFTARAVARDLIATRNASREAINEADQIESGEGERQANQPSPDTARRTPREAAEARISGGNNRQTNGMTTPVENQVSNGVVEEEEDASPSPPNSDEGDSRDQAAENARQEGMALLMQQVLDEQAAGLQATEENVTIQPITEARAEAGSPTTNHAECTH